MSLHEIFLYPKLRSYYLWKKHLDEITNTQCDIMLYMRFFGDADGWVSYAQMREYMAYNIPRWKTRSFNATMKKMEEQGVVEMRERRGMGNRKMKEFNPDTGRSGKIVQYRLTYKGMMRVAEFDEITTQYANKIIVRKQLRAAGLKDADEEFKTLDSFDSQRH